MSDDPPSEPPPHPARTEPPDESWTREADVGFLGLVGPIYSQRNGAIPRFGFRAEARHANRVGIVQGGMIMTFADRALGTMAGEATAGQPCVTISFETQFVGAGRIGAWLALEGEVVRRTADLLFMRGRVLDGHHVVASCQGIWKRVSGRNPAGAQPAGPVSGAGAP